MMLMGRRSDDMNIELVHLGIFASGTEQEIHRLWKRLTREGAHSVMQPFKDADNDEWTTVLQLYPYSLPGTVVQSKPYQRKVRRLIYLVFLAQARALGLTVYRDVITPKGKSTRRYVHVKGSAAHDHMLISIALRLARKSTTVRIYFARRAHYRADVREDSHVGEPALSITLTNLDVVNPRGGKHVRTKRK
jgi:hypothetical protein